MRLIDADALIKTLETQDYSNAPDTLEEWTPQDLTNAEIFDINNAPTVDAVEVVRCKECKFYSEDEKWCEWLGLCGAFNENDFCSHGERRKDNEAG